MPSRAVEFFSRPSQVQYNSSGSWRKLPRKWYEPDDDECKLNVVRMKRISVSRIWSTWVNTDLTK
jgi:hypothetical protein